MMKRRFKENRLTLFILFFLIWFVRYCDEGESITNNDGSIIQFDSLHVALYMDDAVWATCIYYTEMIMEEIGLPYTSVNSSSIKEGALNQYSVLLMPGGWPHNYARKLGESGITAIREYVSNGGGFIGISGAAVFAAEGSDWQGWETEPLPDYEGLGIYKSTVTGPIEAFAPSYQDKNCMVQITNKQHTITAELPDTVYCMYSYGPNFDPNNKSKVTILGRTVKGAAPVIVCTQYGNGNIFLTGLHPEILYEQTSVDLLRNAIEWCSIVD